MLSLSSLYSYHDYVMQIYIHMLCHFCSCFKHFFITLNHDLHQPSPAIHYYFHHHCLFFLYDTISPRQDDLPWWEKQELTRVSLFCYLYFIHFIHFTYYHLRDFFSSFLPLVLKLFLPFPVFIVFSLAFCSRFL